MHFWHFKEDFVFRKASSIKLTAIILVLFALVLACAFIPVNKQAYAEGETWSVRVTKVTTGESGNAVYTDLPMQGTESDKSINLAFLISYPNPDSYTSNDSFYYYESNVREDGTWTNPGIDDLNWRQMGTLTTRDIVNNDGQIVTYKTLRYDPLGGSEQICKKYIYFKRAYTDSDSTTKQEKYEYNWYIGINLQVQDGDLGISNIKAEYQSSSGYVEYKGDWINRPLRFTIKTKWMEKHNAPYNPSDELLFYSVGGEWIAMNSNVLTITKSLQSKVNFEVRNVSQSYSSSAEYPLQVNIDMEKPKFDISAVTTGIDNVQKAYSNKSWASNNVFFQITKNNSCLSPITYFYTTSAMNGEYASLDSSIPYTVRTSTAGLKFRARTAAGSVYDENDDSINLVWDVNIDTVKPVVSLEVLTPNTEVGKPDKVLTTSRIPITLNDANEFNVAKNKYTTLYYFVNNNYISINNFIQGVTKYYYSDNIYYANGKVTFNIYNKDIDGNKVPNTSILCYEWAIDEGEGKTPVFKAINNPQVFIPFGVDTYQMKGTEISENKKFLFRIRSQAGLVSEQVTLETILLNPDFSINNEHVYEYYDINEKITKSEKVKVRYEIKANVNGWTSEPIVVYVPMRSDTVLINYNFNEYTIPTTKYIFHYAPVEIANMVYSAEGKYVRSIGTGWSEYKFELSASANSAFIIYAENLAGQASKDTYRTEEKIMIDTTKPEVWYEAFVMDEEGLPNQPTPVEVPSGMWINGRIHFTLKATIGISSVYAYRLHYIKDAYGNPVRDSSGKIVWLDNSTIMKQTETIDNVAYYYQAMELPNESVVKMTEYYGFRIYTGSGVYTDVEYIANIDTTKIELDYITITYEDGKKPEQISFVANTLTLVNPVSKDFFIKLTSNIEQNGHFDYWLYGENNQKTRIDGLNAIQAIVLSNKTDTNTIVFQLISKAVSYKNNERRYEESGIYTIVYSYNTLEIDIVYSTTASATPDTVWSSGSLGVSVSLKNDGEELSPDYKKDYTYHYMLIKFSDYVSENDALKNGVWRDLKAENNGSYDVLNRFNFIIPFSDTSFNGYIALSVCHISGHRSSKLGFVTNRIRIDNTVPDLTEIITQTIGETGQEDGLTTYYSKNPITLEPVTDINRSQITFYYYQIPDSGLLPEENPASRTDTKQWTWLDANKAFQPDGIKKEYKVLLYAVNELGKTAGGVVSKAYKFVIDTSLLTGSLRHSPSDGGYQNNATGLWSYQWKDTAIIYLSSDNSETDVKFMYSTDKGTTWSTYNKDNPWYKSGTSEKIVFDANIFENGVMATFSFKVVNKAGQEYFYKEDIYIAMDNTAPDFTIDLTVNEAEYYGGSTDFTDTTGEWSSVDINIKINLTVANVSGAKFTYKIYYYKDNTMKTAVDGLPLPNTTSFSSYTILSDSILFPNRSGDIILEITATNKKKPDRFTSHSVRLRIDKTKPTFELKGLASSSDSSTGIYIESAQWTNHTKVVVSRANPAKNASVVKYYLTYEDLSSTAKEQYEWDANNSSRECTQTCTITVRAISEAGLEHTVVFQVNIDTIPPVISFMGGINVVEGEKQFIDLKVVVKEENIKICQYITTIGDTAGYQINAAGQIISTSTVDNSTQYDPNIITDDIENAKYRGYVKIIVEDFAGNRVEFTFYMLPFELNVNNITLSNEDARTLEEYETNLNKARSYMESSRVTYFESLIQRLKDRVNTLRQEIAGYRRYLEELSKRISFELKSDYKEVFKYLEQYRNYELIGQGWIQQAIVEDASSKYYAYYKNLESVFDRLYSQMKVVYAVEENTQKLPAVNVVESADYNSVLTVFDQYNNLTVDQKACFDNRLYTKLLDLKRKCEIMLLTDPDTGIAIDGNFAPGAKIKITEYKPTDETYVNSQSAIMSVLTANDPRAIVSINRIDLTDAASQTATGKVTVTLPIPEDWQQYIKFAIYKVTDDGTVSAIEKTEIQGDGKSIVFTSDELSTFVLCAKANIQATNIKDDVFGTLLGLEMDVRMIRNLVIVGAFIFGIVIIVVIIAGVRHKKFLNSYNRAYRSSRYRKGIQEIPRGNTYPRSNPLKQEERVVTPKHPY